MFRSKRMKAIDSILGDKNKSYSITTGIEILKSCPPVKFVETVDLSVKLGIDPKKPEQQVRGSIILPHGSGKKVTVAVITQGDNVDKALVAGADFVGDKDIETKILSGWTGFDVLIASPDMMGIVGKLGRKLGSRGLMPSPRSGTVTNDIARAVSEFKKGKVEIRSNRFGEINLAVGKLSMKNDEIFENISMIIDEIIKLKPAAASGKYLRSLSISSTMGPGIKVNE